MDLKTPYGNSTFALLIETQAFYAICMNLSTYHMNAVSFNH